MASIYLISCAEHEEIPMAKDTIGLSQNHVDFVSEGDSVVIKTKGDDWWISGITVNNRPYYAVKDILKKENFTVERKDNNTLFIKMNKNHSRVSNTLSVSLQNGNYYDNVSIYQKKGENFRLELEEASEVADENYEIYSMIIEASFPLSKYVISQKSILDVSLGSTYSGADLNHYEETLNYRHVALNQVPVYFDKKFQSESKELSLLSSNELSYLLDGLNWEDYFYKKYQDYKGVIRFSQIAFNEDRNKAVLEMDFSYARYGGEGTVVYLVKENDHWVIKDKVTIWTCCTSGE